VECGSSSITCRTCLIFSSVNTEIGRPDRKSSNATWISGNELPRTVIRRNKSEPKSLFCLFFKSNGPILIHKVDKGKAIDHNYYIENCLKPVINEIRKQEKLSGTKGIKLLHDNGSSHTHRDVIDYLTEEGIEIMPHPPYSPDLVPCDFWLNDYIKRNVTDQENEELPARASVSRALITNPKQEGIQLLFRHVHHEKAVGSGILSWSRSTLKSGRLAIMKDFYVDQSYRGEGIADLLIGECARYAREHGGLCLTWQMSVKNYRAQAVYDRCDG
ncbi:unnamed protein product, partial [Rotaria sp. Silwood2]